LPHCGEGAACHRQATCPTRAPAGCLLRLDYEPASLKLCDSALAPEKPSGGDGHAHSATGQTASYDIACNLARFRHAGVPEIELVLLLRQTEKKSALTVARLDYALLMRTRITPWGGIS
jgi:hypothetical protein